MKYDVAAQVGYATRALSRRHSGGSSASVQAAGAADGSGTRVARLLAVVVLAFDRRDRVRPCHDHRCLRGAKERLSQSGQGIREGRSASTTSPSCRRTPRTPTPRTGTPARRHLQRRPSAPTSSNRASLNTGVDGADLDRVRRPWSSVPEDTVRPGLRWGHPVTGAVTADRGARGGCRRGDRAERLGCGLGRCRRVGAAVGAGVAARGRRGARRRGRDRLVESGSPQHSGAERRADVGVHLAGPALGGGP